MDELFGQADFSGIEDIGLAAATATAKGDVEEGRVEHAAGQEEKVAS